MKTYMLTYHWALPTNVLDALGGAGVDEWLQVWPGMVFFKGDESQEHYAAKIKEQSKVAMFVIAEYDARRSQGWMPPSVWEWLRPAPQTPIVPPQIFADNMSHSPSAS